MSFRRELVCPSRRGIAVPASADAGEGARAVSSGAPLSRWFRARRGGPSRIGPGRPGWLLAALLAGAVAAPARAQVLHLVPGARQLSAEYDEQRQEQTDVLDTRRTALRTRLRIPFAGTLVHPKILDYDFYLEPLWERQGLDGFQPAPNTLHMRQVLDGGNVRLLHGLDFPFTWSFGRTAFTNRGDLGEAADTRARFSTAQLEWRNRYLPVRLERLLRTNDAEWRAAGDAVAIHRVESSRTTRLQARNSKTMLQLDRTSFAERVSGFAFDATLGQLYNTFRWGKGSTVLTSSDLQRYGGAIDNSRVAWAQRGHIQHTRTIYTDGDYDLARQWAGGASGGSRSTTLQLNDDVTRWLTLGVRGTASRVTFDGEGQRMIGAGPAMRFVLPAWRGVTLTGAGAFLYERHVYDATGAVASVIDERVAVDSSRRATLARRQVVAGSVTVTSADHTIQYLRDTDYQLAGAGPVTELWFVPGGRIAAGDTVLVSYRFALPPGQRFAMGVADYNVSATAGPLTVYHQRLVRVGGGAELALVAGEYDDMETGADLAHVGSRVSVSLHAGERRFGAYLADYEAVDLRASLSAALTPSWRASGSLGGNRSTSGLFRARSASAIGGLSWMPMPLLRLDGEVSAWRWRQSGAPDANIFGGGVGLEYQLGGTTLGARWDRTIRLDREIPYRDSRLTTHLSRSF